MLVLERPDWSSEKGFSLTHILYADNNLLINDKLFLTKDMICAILCER